MIRKKSGFTLMEMMVVLAVFSIVMGIAYTALTLNDSYRSLVFTRIELYRQLRQAMNTVNEELQKSQASRVTINSDPLGITFQIPLVNSMDTQYNVPWGASYGGTDYPDFFIRYRLNGTNIERDILNNTLSPVADTEQVMVTDVTSLQLVQPSPGYITININVRKVSAQPARPVTINLSLNSSVSLRN